MTTPRILLVDDELSFERLIRQRLRHKIKEGQFELLFACDGIDALKTLKDQEGIDIVLTDINMPNMDGLTLISELEKTYPLLKSIVVSAYGDMKNIRTAMNLGAFDFITKPVDFVDLETTITKTLHETKLLQKVEEAKALAKENDYLLELDQLKTYFFTNISHEFRTPLTIIKGMSQQIKDAPQKWLTKGIPMIDRNATHLLTLVKEILDLRKLESGKMSLNLVQSNIFPLIQYLARTFQSMAEARDIKLHFLYEVDEIIMDYDGGKVQQIISNLLNNAIKFTPEGGEIFLTLEVQSDSLKMTIKDTGIGILPKDLDKVFHRFYQTKNEAFTGQQGTGVGLALSKELVSLMKGTIKVASIKEEGTTFIIVLPIEKNATLLRNNPDSSSTEFYQILPNQIPKNEFDSSVMDSDLPSLLIIEDNLDIAQYITSCLEGIYKIEWAKDGQEGIEKAKFQIPDLIISDVMMPKKNGFEVCAILKNEITTNHIPIILLTAKVDDESKLQGLERGADAYLAKPFDKKELIVRLENLLILRDKLRNHYTNEDISLSDTASLSPEEEFIFRVRDIIGEKMADDTFDSNQLCKDMLMSRSLLFLKLKAMTGFSASLYIRLLRLQRAKKILETSSLNVSQVAYEVGFKDPKYFSRLFSKQYGIPPSSVRM